MDGRRSSRAALFGRGKDRIRKQRQRWVARWFTVADTVSNDRCSQRHGAKLLDLFVLCLHILKIPNFENLNFLKIFKILKNFGPIRHTHSIFMIARLTKLD